MTVKLSASRRAALHTLQVARERNAYVRELLNSKAGFEGRAGLDERDAAFAERLALGVAATYGTLDDLIDRFINRRLDEGVRDALRISTFEILYLGKEPHAAVSQGVELVKTQAKSAAGLANAVLRRVSEHAQEFLSESPAHAYGLPQWLCKRVEHDLGAAGLEEFGKAGLTQAPIYLANVPMWIDDSQAAQAFADAGVDVQPAGAVPGSWYADNPSKAVTCSLVTGHDVKAIVTDYGAQSVACLAAPLSQRPQQSRQRMLEVGSGRGTKTILMAGHTYRRGGTAQTWSLDVHASRAQVAQDRLMRARVKNVTQVTGDARHASSIQGLPHEFNRIFIDAPCSGTGTLRRHPEITWSLTQQGVDDLARTQSQILHDCASLLVPGGTLVYATCSVLCEENEDVVEEFLDSTDGTEFETVRPADAVEDAALARELDAHTSPDGYLRTMVHEGGCDGHFCAILHRKG